MPVLDTQRLYRIDHYCAGIVTGCLWLIVELRSCKLELEWETAFDLVRSLVFRPTKDLKIRPHKVLFYIHHKYHD